jgi:hypothetical protein
MMSTVFWVVTQWISEKPRCFGGKHHLHRHGRRVNKAANQLLLPAGFFLGLLFDLEDGGDIFLQSVRLFQTTWRYKPEDLLFTIIQFG